MDLYRYTYFFFNHNSHIYWISDLIFRADFLFSWDFCSQGCACKHVYSCACIFFVLKNF